MQETTDWLKKQIDHGVGYDDDSMKKLGGATFSCHEPCPPTSDGCLLSFERNGHRAKVDLSNIDAQRVRFNAGPINGIEIQAVVLRTIDDQRSISWYWPPQDMEFSLPTIHFFVEDQEIGERVVRAFQHAVRLCAGATEPEPF